MLQERTGRTTFSSYAIRSAGVVRASRWWPGPVSSLREWLGRLGTALLAWQPSTWSEVPYRAGMGGGLRLISLRELAGPGLDAAGCGGL